MSLKFNQEVFEKFGLKKLNDKKDLIALINDEIRNRVARTPAERAEVLELRDKILKCVRYVTENENVQQLRGTCMDMCPEKERYHRESINQYNNKEMRRDTTTGSFVLDHRLMIKEYSRSAADQDLPLSNELRSSMSLLRTIQHVLKTIVSQVQLKTESDGIAWIADWFDFIWNRTRAIRKDITQQRLNDRTSVQIHEICARFHIYCSHRFCDQAPEIFAFKINNDHLNNCLQSLIEFYDDPLTEPSQNEAEFRAYMILNMLDDGRVLSKTQRLKPHIRNSVEVNYALKLFFAYTSRNYTKFFRLVSANSLNYLAACLTHRYFTQMRIDALKTISSAYKQASERQYPLDKLIEILGFNNEADVVNFCEQLGIDVISDQNETEKYAWFPQNFRNQTIEKSLTERLRQRRSLRLIESKFQTNTENISDIINGERIPPLAEPQLAHQSFDANGNYIANDFAHLESVDFGQGARRARTPPPPSTSTAAATLFPPQRQQQANVVVPAKGNLFERIVGGGGAPKPEFGTRTEAPGPTAARNLFNSIVNQAQQQQQPASSLFPQLPTQQQPVTNLFSRYKTDTVPAAASILPTATFQPPSTTVTAAASPLKFNFIDDIYLNLLDDCLISYASSYLNESKWRLGYIYNTVFEETLKESVEQCVKTELLKEQLAKQFADDLLNKTVNRMVRHVVEDEVSLVRTSQNKIDYQSNQIFDELCIDITSSQLILILAELKYEYLESLYINVYFNEIFPVHLNEILNEFIYEDTQFCLNVNLDLASDLNLSIDYSLVKLVFSKWYLKSKKQQQQQQQKRQLELNRIELTKNYLFKFVRCESYLLHLCWIPVNYQHLINNLSVVHANSLLLYKFMFILPKLGSLESETEFIKRWLLSKFFQFDRKTFTYNTQYSYYLLNSFLQQFGVKFCIKACFTSQEAKVDTEKMSKRVYYASTGVIFVLMPFTGTTEVQFQSYLNENRTQLRKTVRFINENLDEDDIIANLRFFIISYLNDDQQTQNAIDFILKPATSTDKDHSKKRKSLVVYCQVDGKVVRDNQIIEENFATYLMNSYIQTPKECLQLTILSFFDIFEMTILKFFDYMNKKNVNMPFNVIIEEYNLRLDLLIGEFLSKSEYKKLTWPIPEHTDFTKAWLAKFWNTKEVIDDKLYEIRNLLSLHSTSEIHNSLSTRDYKRARHDILSYLNEIQKQKAAYLDEYESVYQIESKIVSILKDLERNKKEIKWQKFISIIIEFILTNGFVNFRSKKIHFDQFTIYCNFNELKSYDWVNCGENRLVDYESSISEYVSAATSTTMNDESDYEPLSKTTKAYSDATTTDAYSDVEENDHHNNIDETSHYQMNRRNYFNKTTNMKLNEEFEFKIKTFLNIVQTEKTQVLQLDKKLLNSSSNTPPPSTNNQLKDVNRLDSLLNSLNEETNYNRKLNEKLENLLKN